MRRFSFVIVLLLTSLKASLAQLVFQPTPIKYPARVAWGTFMYSEQLFDNPANWKFVRDNIDVYLMHQQYWLNTNYLVYCKGPTAGKSRWAEFAAIIGDKPVSLENAVYFHAWGVPTATDGDVGKIWAQRIMTDQVTPLRNAGINLTEVNIDMGPKAGLGGIARRHPDWDEGDLTALYGSGTAGGYIGTKPVGNGIWKTFTEELYKQNPKVSANIVAAHVFFDWKEPGKTPLTSISSHLIFDPLMDQAGTSPVLVNGQPVSLTFDGYQWFTSHFKGGNPAINTNFVSDTPYEYWNWPNTTVRDDYRKIIKTYEEWLHANGREHHLIVTGGAQGAENPLDGQPDDAYCNASQTVRDQLDLVYYNKSMQGIQLYQRLGMRPDMYVVESWLKYPYDVANENKSGSFAKLGKDIINYVKGPNQKLDLIMTAPNNNFGNGVYEAKAIDQKFNDVLPAIGSQKTYEFTFSNASGITILPMLKMQKLQLDGTTVTVYSGTTDITNQIQSLDGYTYANQLVNPSTAIKVVVSNTSKAPNSEGGFCLWLYWNPQDPLGPRDAMAVTYNENAILNCWDFASSTEGWNNPTRLTMSVANNINTITISGADANMYSPNNLDLDAAQYKYVVIGMQNQTSATSAELFWTTTTDGTFNSTKRVGFSIIANDVKQRYYIIDLSANTNWTGTIRQLRLDPSTASSGTVKLDVVKLTGSYPTNLSTIPGIIEAENFNIGGQGNAYNDLEVANNGANYRLADGVDIQATGDAGGGYNIGWTRDGEWLEYLVNVTETTNYLFKLRVAAAAIGGSVQLYIDGEALGAAIAIPFTGGVATYQDVEVTYNVPQGLHLVRVQIVKGGINLNKITITKANQTPTNITLSASAISENLAVGSMLATISSTDPDVANTFTYTLAPGGTDNASFIISGNTIKSNAIFDFEAKQSYTIKLRTTDQGGLYFEKLFTISISDVNDTPKITKFQLIKGGTSTVIVGYDPLSNNSVIDLSKLTETQFNLFAIPSYGADSVVFVYNLNGEIGKQKDILAPFALKGDGVNYKKWQLTPGSYTITANLYLLGSKTDTQTLSFSVKDVLTTLLVNDISNSYCVYPNPATTMVTIKNSSMQDESYSVSIYNVASEMVYEKEGCTNNQNIDITNILPGIYFISITTANKTLTNKILIKR